MKSKAILLMLALVLVFTRQSYSQSNETCLDCHSDPSISKEVNGKEVSLTVKKFQLSRSVHGKLNCVQCHVGFDPDNVPHKAKIEPVNCQSCHKNAAQLHPFHPQMAKALAGGVVSAITNCKSCHGTHEITNPDNPESKQNYVNATEFCGNCHKDEKAAHEKSEHYVALTKHNSNVPTCIYCHSKPITSGYPLSELQLKKNQIDLCLSCHLNNPAVKSPFAKSLIKFEQSVHGRALASGKTQAPGCIDCHGVHDLQKSSNPSSRINKFNVPNVCGKCHINIEQEFASSIHGIQLKKGNPDVPGCTFCHGEHDIKPIPETPPRIFDMTGIKKTTAEKTKMVYCLVCHQNESLMSKYNISIVSKAHEWLPNQSVHWETVRCVDCHSSYAPPNLSHNILPPDKTVKKCEECHNQNSILMSKLYQHEKQSSREKFGFINGTLLSDAYVIGTTRNVFLDSLSLLIIGGVIMGIGLHGFLRWYFTRGGK